MRTSDDGRFCLVRRQAVLLLLLLLLPLLLLLLLLLLFRPQYNNSFQKRIAPNSSSQISRSRLQNTRTPTHTMSAAGGGPNLNAWKAILDFSTRHTEPEPNPDIKPMSAGAAARSIIEFL